MYRMRDIARKGLAPPVLLLLCLLINIWARWPILMHIDEVFTISWRVCTALVTGGISLVLSLTGLVTLISNQTQEYPESVRCFTGMVTQNLLSR